ncbi:GNAT family N-acetyltransferase [Algicella marina]|uniref:GNAT family N-acetyltransferase n=1 Tax=Algicella marina TaxID=2683284 RepID=A0A6P1T021_9RHOB|nr:GNAT family protein [Algicella marina]QHQ35210.1 GNAT family N-acetyltransferase [Algicella marina]
MTEPVLTKVPILRTERLLLRPLEARDAGHLELYAGDRRVARMTTSIPHPYPPGGGASFIARIADPEEYHWAIVQEASSAGELLGVITLRPDGELGYWIGAPFWNTGFATEAVEAVVSFGHSIGHKLLNASVFQDNAASAKVLTKAGFNYLGEAEAYSIARGAKVDLWTYTRKAP